MGTRFCTACGRQSAYAEERFCGRCGQAFPAQQPDEEVAEVTIRRDALFPAQPAEVDQPTMVATRLVPPIVAQSGPPAPVAPLPPVPEPPLFAPVAAQASAYTAPPAPPAAPPAAPQLHAEAAGNTAPKAAQPLDFIAAGTFAVLALWFAVDVVHNQRDLGGEGLRFLPSREIGASFPLAGMVVTGAAAALLALRPAVGRLLGLAAATGVVVDAVYTGLFSTIHAHSQSYWEFYRHYYWLSPPWPILLLLGLLALGVLIPSAAEIVRSPKAEPLAVSVLYGVLGAYLLIPAGLTAVAIPLGGFVSEDVQLFLGSLVTAAVAVLLVVFAIRQDAQPWVAGVAAGVAVVAAPFVNWRWGHLHGFESVIPVLGWVAVPLVAAMVLLSPGSRPKPLLGQAPTGYAAPAPGFQQPGVYQAPAYGQQGFPQQTAGYPAQPAYGGYAPADTTLRSSVPTVLITVFFGLTGIAAAAIQTSNARKRGLETGKYWKAFLITQIVSAVVWIGFWAVIIAALNHAANGYS